MLYEWSHVCQFADVTSDLIMRETTQYREAFECYLNLGSDRSLSRLREKLIETNETAPVLRTLSEWSRKLNWQARIDALEQEAATDASELYVATKQEVNRRHARDGARFQELAIEWILAMDPADVTLAAASRMFDIGNRIEREARGLNREDIDPVKPDFVEVRLIMGGPDELYMFPDPDQDAA